jgi:hypothetical protein
MDFLERSLQKVENNGCRPYCPKTGQLKKMTVKIKKKLKICFDLIMFLLRIRGIRILQPGEKISGKPGHIPSIC